jgi:hypothetical protein
MPGEFVVLMMMMVVVASAVGIIVWSLGLSYKRRVLQHKERLAALEKGMPLPVLTDVETRAPWSPRVYLLRGMIWLFIGIGLTAFLGALSVTAQHPRSIEERVREANWARQNGASEDQVRQVQDDTSPQNGPGLGIALLGLVPMGVGAAYLIFYRVEGKYMTVPTAHE